MTFAENVVAVFDRATPDEMHEGMSWYADAHNFAMSLDSDVWRAAGVIAALSPQKRWSTNAILARRAYETGTPTGHTGVMLSQAARILNGENALDVLKGPKVRAFCAGIATAGNTDMVTIDRHAHDIAMGRVFTDSERKIGAVLYRRLAAHYTEAAREVGVSVCQIQAVTWVRWRNEKELT